MIFNFLRGKSSVDTPEKEKAPSLLARLSGGLAKTRARLSQTLNQLFLREAIDEAFLEQLYDACILADCGPDTADFIVETTKNQYFQAPQKPEDLEAFVADILASILTASDGPAYTPHERNEIILLVGVNGVGKTTTIGRLAHRFHDQGHSVTLAAGDTFRAAAIEQLQTWGERSNTPVIAQHSGADSASVIFDAYQHACSNGIDIVLADTAGRLHNKDHLMAELAKINRVLAKLNPKAPHQTWLVLDATVGQNGLRQAEAFHKHMHLTGIILTKLDGTAKGGIAFAIAHKLKLPIMYVGVGEKREDLMPFDAKSFVAALLTKD